MLRRTRKEATSNWFTEENRFGLEVAMLGNSSLQEDRERPAQAAPSEEESGNGYVTLGNNKYCKADRS